MSAQPNEPQAPTPQSGTEAIPGQEALGDAGKQALDRMKQDRNQARADLAALRAEFDAFKATVQPPAPAKPAADAADEALAKVNRRILQAEVRAAAAGKLADPADALRFLDVGKFAVDSDGVTDVAAIATAVEELITRKPYLAAAAPAPRFPAGADGGVRASGPAQMTKAEVEQLYAARRYDDIAKAQAEGRLNSLLGIK